HRQAIGLYRSATRSRCLHLHRRGLGPRARRARVLGPSAGACACVMKPSDIPLVRGGKLTPKIIEWIEKVSKVFPGIEKDMVIIRKPGFRPLPRGGKQANQQARKE